MTEVDPEEKQIVIESFTNLIKKLFCPVLELWSRVLCHCHTVLKNIARDPSHTTMYKGQGSSCPMQVSILKLHAYVVTLGLKDNNVHLKENALLKHLRLIHNNLRKLFQVRNTLLTLHW